LKIDTSVHPQTKPHTFADTIQTNPNISQSQTLIKANMGSTTNPTHVKLGVALHCCVLAFANCLCLSDDGIVLFCYRCTTATDALKNTNQQPGKDLLV
jgi:hypothetical protein